MQLDASVVNGTSSVFSSEDQSAVHIRRIIYCAVCLQLWTCINVQWHCSVLPEECCEVFIELLSQCDMAKTTYYYLGW